MIFNRRRLNNAVTQTPTNKAMNKLLTYGLIFFFVYAVYNNSQHKSPLAYTPPKVINYSPINWSNYVKVKNLITDEETSYNFVDNNKLVLSLSQEELDDAAVPEKGKALPVYELEFDNRANWNTIFQPPSH